MAQKRDGFGSKFGAIAALAGSAVGLGNIWKFPYEAGNNGGGAFLLIYIAFIFLLGVPLMLSEFALGRATQHNVFGAFKILAPKTKWYLFSILAIAASVAIMAFYGTISGWTLEYVWVSLNDGFAGKNEQELASMFNNFIADPYRAVAWQLGFLVLSALIVIGGIKNGIERSTKIMMPVLFLIIVLLGIRACTLPGAMEGIKFLFVPDFSAITGQSVLSAMGQVFFSLSLGSGVLMTYASYVSKKGNLPGMSMQVIAADTGIAILAGIAILPAVFSFGIDPTSGPGLVFMTLPRIFQSLPFGQLWAVCFFILLTFAALTSAISMIEVIVAYLVEERQMSRAKSTALTVGVIAVLSVLCTLSFGVLKDCTVAGLTFFDMFDYLSSKIILPLGAILLCYFTGWYWDRKALYAELTNNNTIRLRFFKTYVFILRYIAPALITVIFISSF
ncbi:MAG: sodium-dependent transporter [Marinifilaceae bacterium]